MKISDEQRAKFNNLLVEVDDSLHALDRDNALTSQAKKTYSQVPELLRDCLDSSADQMESNLKAIRSSIINLPRPENRSKDMKAYLNDLDEIRHQIDSVLGIGDDTDRLELDKTKHPEVAAEFRAELAAMKDRLKSVEEQKPEPTTTVILQGLINFYVPKIEFKLKLSKFNFDLRNQIDLQVPKELLDGITKLISDFYNAIEARAIKAAKALRDSVNALRTGAKSLVKSFGTLVDLSLFDKKPPDEATRKAWEAEAAVQILMGKAVPARRVPFIQALNLSGWDEDLKGRLKAAGADLAAIYVDPEDIFKGLKFADASVLAKFPALQTLDLRRTQVTDIAPLSGLTALQELNLHDTKVTDIAPLSGLTALQKLYLNGTKVADLAPLSGLTALQVLYLTNTKVADIAPLAGLTALQVLWLIDTKVTDIAPLSGLTALQMLYLNYTQVTDIAPLSGLTALQSLRLDDTKVTDIAPLSGLTALQELYLSNTQVADISPLSGLTALKEVDLQNTRVTDFSPVAHLERVWGDPERDKDGYKRDT